MKKLITLAACTIISLSGLAQTNETKSQIRVFGGGLAPIEWGNDYTYFGGGVGISAPLSQRWVLNGDMAWYSRDIPSGAGYVDRDVLDFRGSIDFYFSRAFKGLFVGANFGYVGINSSVEEGGNPIAGPTGYVPFGFQLGLNTALSSKLDFNIKAAWGSQPGGAGAYTYNMGLGYKL
ncbi:hypothetical protein [Phaeocystidibacter luteus]|uniref:Porin family protein n=1 Tax=Phaeocystidibacter luteus TaxID=911197 RepID=A0A6N6RJD4_9FLAO|nr:hypothetical protein [Phaeocystidibacter luteus]KAB2813784.1 hypothetical protein F8C67_06390 [Phaeocystidibacter luteus]